MSIMILERDENLREEIQEQLETLGMFRSVMVASSILEAETMIIDKKISIFIVDLDLPDGSGHEFIKNIRQQSKFEYSWVVVVADKEEPCESILAEINCSRCDRIIKKPFQVSYLTEVVKGLSTRRVVARSLNKRLKIKRKSVDYYFDYEDIVYVETVEKVAYIYTMDQRYKLGRMTLNELYERLNDNKRFHRVHRSYIINVDYIDYIKKKNNQNQIKIKHYDTFIPVGRTYKDILEKVH